MNTCTLQKGEKTKHTYYNYYNKYVSYECENDGHNIYVRMLILDNDICMIMR